MKKLIVFVAIATVVFTSCKSKTSSFEEFKQIIQNSRLDSCYIHNYMDGVNMSYDFYLPYYHISVYTEKQIKSRQPESIMIFTDDTTSELVTKFCFPPSETKQNKEILLLLLSKKTKNRVEI